MKTQKLKVRVTFFEEIEYDPSIQGDFCLDIQDKINTLGKSYQAKYPSAEVSIFQQ